MTEQYIRTCQECGHKQLAKPPATYNNDAWRDIQCKKCKSIALDYGKFVDASPVAYTGNQVGK